MITETIHRTDLLHQIARNYVLNGMGGKDFDAIPYDDNVILRAPINAGGSSNPLRGKENLRTQWWAPLPGLLGSVKLLDTFVNEENSAVTVEFHCEIINPACTLRIVDRFTVNENGKIIEQENFFDPRDITNPGWR
jgi:hypothetical protein